MLLKVEYMEKIDLLTFLEDESEQLDFDGQVEVFWDKKHKLFEIELTFYAENKSGQVIESSPIYSLWVTMLHKNA